MRTRQLGRIAVAGAALFMVIPAPVAIAAECEHYYVDPTPGPDPYIFEEHYECTPCPTVPSVSLQGDRLHLRRCRGDIT